MKKLNHPNIGNTNQTKIVAIDIFGLVKLLEVMENESMLYMVLEYASGGLIFYIISLTGADKNYGLNPRRHKLGFKQEILIRYNVC